MHEELNESPRAVMPPLDLSRASAGLYAALAKAQAAVANVDKAGRNLDAKYAYATADDMIAGGRAARAASESGLSLITTWTAEYLDEPENAGNKERGGPGQWTCAIVTLHFVLAHSSGGVITGVLALHAIGSRRRPPDKAVAAAATYGEGFIERNLMRLSRHGEDEGDVDRRSEEDYGGGRDRREQQREQQQPPPAGEVMLSTGELIVPPKNLAAIKTDADLEAYCVKWGDQIPKARAIVKLEELGRTIGGRAAVPNAVRGWLKMPAIAPEADATGAPDPDPAALSAAEEQRMERELAAERELEAQRDREAAAALLAEKEKGDSGKRSRK